ncbi:MAG: hypothetical protein GY928_25290 [Colwellia sp.]|nr:hypothetical protein [Colwellia sp.]
MKYYKCHIKRFLHGVGIIELNLILAVIVVILNYILLSGSLRAAVYEAASCSMSDVQAAIDNAGRGDTVTIPVGECTWGADKTYLRVDKAITLMGEGQGQTIITLSDSGGLWVNGTIRISAAATVKSMTINGSNVNTVCAFSTSTANNWRITDIDYNGGTSGAYFVYVSAVYGLIDNNDITGGTGTAELIFVRGPTDSWQTPHSIGGADNVFIENNTYNGRGYVCDINSNGRAVVRYNTITGPIKIDGHGKASNSPPRGVRHMEIYNNTWTSTTAYWFAVELRGGGGRVFDNVIESSDIWVALTDYGATHGWPNFDSTCQCPEDYPIDDQIGVGMDPKTAASEPMYLWNNTRNGVPWTISGKSTAGCTDTCGEFEIFDIIKEGRDYFMSDTKPAAMDGYFPYTYPHPLANPLATLSPPKNVRVESN